MSKCFCSSGKLTAEVNTDCRHPCMSNIRIDEGESLTAVRESEELASCPGTWLGLGLSHPPEAEHPEARARVLGTPKKKAGTDLIGQAPVKRGIMAWQS
jgi:hypothetical protein